MTRGEMKVLLAGWLDDLQYGYFTETQLNSWLNLGQERLQKKLIKAGENYYVKTVSTTLVVNQREYVLPDDFRKLHRLEVINSGTAPNESVSPVTPITINQKDLIEAVTGTPAAYYIRKGRLVLYPAPNSALTLRMDYSYRVADMTLDTDVPDAPAHYHEYIPLRAAKIAFLKDQKAPDLIVEMLNEYGDELDSDADERNQDVSRQIVQTGAYDSAGMIF